MKPVHNAGSSRHRRRFRWSRLFLPGAVVLFASAYYHERFYLPDRMLKEAIATSSRSIYEAEKQVAHAIDQAGGLYPEAELFRTQLFVAQGRGDEALGQFSLIANPEELPADKLCELGRVAMSRREMLLAEKAFASVPEESEFYRQVLRSLIQIHLEMGKDDQTLIECRRLVELEPHDTTAWQVLGTIAMNRKDLSDAMTAFHKCLQHSKDPQQLRETREDLIQVLIDQGYTVEAGKEIDVLKSVSGPLSPRALIEQAYVFRLEGQAENAIPLLEPLVRREDTFQMRALFLRGLLYADIGEDKKALADLTAVTDRQPWHKEAHHKLSILWSRAGNTSLAAEHRQKAERLTDLALELLETSAQLAQDPTNMDVRKRVAFLYEQLGEPDQAQRLLSVPSYQVN